VRSLIFDVETSTKNTGNPFTNGNFLVSIGWGFSDSDDVGFSYYRDPDFLVEFEKALLEADEVVGVNIKFDIHWLRNAGLDLPDVKVWDCSIAEFIMSGQKSVLPSMDKMCAYYNIIGKQGGLEEYWSVGISTEAIPLQVVKDYQDGDIARTKRIYAAQKQDPRLSKTPNLHNLIYLDGEDLKVLQEMEYNGIVYDIEGSLAESQTLQKEARELEEWLRSISCDKSAATYTSSAFTSAFTIISTA